MDGDDSEREQRACSDLTKVPAWLPLAAQGRTPPCFPLDMATLRRLIAQYDPEGKYR